MGARVAFSAEDATRKRAFLLARSEFAPRRRATGASRSRGLAVARKGVVLGDDSRRYGVTLGWG